MNRNNPFYTFTPVKFKKHAKLNKINEYNVQSSKTCLSMDCNAQIMLDYFLYKHFDSSLIFNQKRIEKKEGYIHCLSAGYPFNFYTYPSIEKMCQDILNFSSYLKQNQNASEAINAYLHKINNDGDYLLPHHIEEILLIQSDYYERFIYQLKNLMNQHPDYHLISVYLP